ncbi:potassium channel protein [Metabacillus iocasae]|uniref:Voltage-gated potassium channel n=1 Tax=Priestia iocasae TaxID=2291674 RepID=A0ABS2QYT4_9BACI|nr:potassium channel family protein [Metabacillus iocasae]MBM7704654.1 voltage-gated potassium channel [Metabacillus iocasae]
MLEKLLFRFFRRSILIRLLSIIIIIIIMFGITIHFIEPESFTTAFDGIWWVVVTISTVGYGDFVPKTILGKVVAILLILIGTGFITTYFVTLATVAVSKENAYMEGNLKFYNKNHLIIVGWNERAKLVIEEYKQAFHEEEIVLIDETLTTNPMVCDRVHFVKGSASHYNILELANVKQAQKILITADQHKGEEYSDMQAILTLVAVKGLNPSIYSMIEILTEQQMNNAEHVGANEIIKTNELISKMMYHEIFTRKTEGKKVES